MQKYLNKYIIGFVKGGVVLAKLSPVMFIVSGLLLSVVSKAIDAENLKLFFWIGILFLLIGAAKLAMKFVNKKIEEKKQNNCSPSNTNNLSDHAHHTRHYTNHNKTHTPQTQGHNVHYHQKHPVHHHVPHAIFCPKCGLKISRHANFCPNCGTRLKQIVAKNSY